MVLDRYVPPEVSESEDDESDEEEVKAHLRRVTEQPPLKLDVSSEVRARANAHAHTRTHARTHTHTVLE